MGNNPVWLSPKNVVDFVSKYFIHWFLNTYGFFMTHESLRNTYVFGYSFRRLVVFLNAVGVHCGMLQVKITLCQYRKIWRFMKLRKLLHLFLLLFADETPENCALFLSNRGLELFMRCNKVSSNNYLREVSSRSVVHMFMSVKGCTSGLTFPDFGRISTLAWVLLCNVVKYYALCLFFFSLHCSWQALLYFKRFYYSTYLYFLFRVFLSLF